MTSLSGEAFEEGRVGFTQRIKGQNGHTQKKKIHVCPTYLEKWCFHRQGKVQWITSSHRKMDKNKFGACRPSGLNVNVTCKNGMKKHDLITWEIAQREIWHKSIT